MLSPRSQMELSPLKIGAEQLINRSNFSINLGQKVWILMN